MGDGVRFKSGILQGFQVPCSTVTLVVFMPGLLTRRSGWNECDFAKQS